MLQIYVTIGEKTAWRGRKGGFGLTSQEKKEFLSRYLEILAEEKDIREEIAYWESKAQKVTASWSAVPSGGKGSDKVQTGAIKVAELRESLKDKINQLAAVRIEIERAIGTVQDDTQRRLLRLRYIKGIGFNKIAEEMNYGERQIQRIHGKALLACKIPDDVIECHIENNI